MDDLDEKLERVVTNVRARQQARENENEKETQRREERRREILERYEMAKKQILELRNVHAKKLDFLDAHGDSVLVEMQAVGLNRAASVFDRGRRELEAMLGSGNLANIDVGIRRLRALDLNAWAGAADVIGALRGEAPTDYSHAVSAAIYGIDNSVDQYNARCKVVGKESKIVGYLPDFSPQEPAKPRVITSKDVPDDAA